MDGARILERWNFRYTRRTQENVPFLFGVFVLYAYAPSAYHRRDSRINRKSVTVARKSKPILTTPAALVARALLCMRTHDNCIKFSGRPWNLGGSQVVVGTNTRRDIRTQTFVLFRNAPLTYSRESTNTSFPDPPSVYFCVCTDSRRVAEDVFH
jgi:hypothetical protein